MSCFSSSVKFGRAKQLDIYSGQGIRSFVEFISLWSFLSCILFSWKQLRYQLILSFWSKEQLHIVRWFSCDFSVKIQYTKISLMTNPSAHWLLEQLRGIMSSFFFGRLFSYWKMSYIVSMTKVAKWESSFLTFEIIKVPFCYLWTKAVFWSLTDHLNSGILKRFNRSVFMVLPP